MATDAWRAVAPHLARHREARVLVIGGMRAVIGLYSAGLAVALGAQVIDYLDDDDERRRVAAEYGARCVADVGEGLYHLIVVANPRKAALARAFAAAAPGCTITSVASAIDGQVELDTRPLYHRGVTWSIGRPDCRHADDGTLAAWANCGFRPDLVPTRRAPWESAPEAWLSNALYVAAVRI